MAAILFLWSPMYVELSPSLLFCCFLFLSGPLGWMELRKLVLWEKWYGCVLYSKTSKIHTGERKGVWGIVRKKKSKNLTRYYKRICTHTSVLSAWNEFPWPSSSQFNVTFSRKLPLSGPVPLTSGSRGTTYLSLVAVHSYNFIFVCLFG